MQKLSAAFNDVVAGHCDKDDMIDIHRLAYLTALDSVCMATFEYPLNALSGSKDGEEVYDCLYMQDEVYNVAQGISPPTNVNEEQVRNGKIIYAGFIGKLFDHVTASSTTHGVVTGLQKLAKATSDNHVKSEIHVLFDHGVRLVLTYSLTHSLTHSLIHSLRLHPPLRGPCTHWLCTAPSAPR